MSEEQQESNPREQPLRIEIAGSPREFANFAEFDSWHNAEWPKIISYSKSDGHYRNFVQQHVQRLNNALKLWRQAGQPVEAHELQQAAKVVYSRAFPSDTPRGAFLHELAQENPQAAGAAAGYWFKQQADNLHDSGRLAGIVGAILFDRGITESKDAYSATLGAAEKEFREWLAESKSDFVILTGELDEEQDRWEQHAKDADERADKYQSDLSKWSKDFKKTSEGMRDQLIGEGRTEKERLTKEINQLVETYDQHMSLQWPSKYWKDKGIDHEKRAGRLRTWFAWLTTASLLIVLLLSLVVVTPLEDAVLSRIHEPTIDPATNAIVPGTEYQPSETSPIAKLTVFGVIMAIVFWVLRLVARSMQSHQHLAADAAERRIMIMTYLALLRRGKGVSDAQLVVVLNSIFRPSTDGLVKEERGPSPLPFELWKTLRSG